MRIITFTTAIAVSELKKIDKKYRKKAYDILDMLLPDTDISYPDRVELEIKAINLILELIRIENQEIVQEEMF